MPTFPRCVEDVDMAIRDLEQQWQGEGRLGAALGSSVTDPLPLPTFRAALRVRRRRRSRMALTVRVGR